MPRYRDALTGGRKEEANAKSGERGAGLVQGLGRREIFGQPLKNTRELNTKSLETISVCSMDIKWRIHRGRKC